MTSKINAKYIGYISGAFSKVCLKNHIFNSIIADSATGHHQENALLDNIKQGVFFRKLTPNSLINSKFYPIFSFSISFDLFRLIFNESETGRVHFGYIFKFLNPKNNNLHRIVFAGMPPNLVLIRRKTHVL